MPDSTVVPSGERTPGTRRIGEPVHGAVTVPIRFALVVRRIRDAKRYAIVKGTLQRCSANAADFVACDYV
jgi:hypothetical protein